nr:330_t:CDS:2 [Entrophospora candida]
MTKALNKERFKDLPKDLDQILIFSDMVQYNFYVVDNAKNILSMSLLIQIYMFPMNLEMAAEYNDYNKYKINEGTWALDTT